MQFTLLFKNMKVLQTIMLADFFKAENTASDQLCNILFGRSALEMNMEYTNLTKLKVNQVIPASAGAGDFCQVLKDVQELKMDPTALGLSLVIGLVSVPDAQGTEDMESVKMIQKEMKGLLFRYSNADLLLQFITHHTK